MYAFADLEAHADHDLLDGFDVLGVYDGHDVHNDSTAGGA